VRRRDGTRQFGATVVEVAVGASLAAVFLGLGTRLSMNSMKDSNGMYVRTGLSMRASETTNQIVRELQLATISGEDVNWNKVLDPGEDINRNGALDCAWSLADGASASSISFNPSLDGWTWGAPVTYFLSSGTLMRRENGQDREICRGVTGFQVTRTGHLVDVDLTLSAKDRTGNRWTETSSRRADVRNQ
jgi:hypothetical protein